MMWSGASGVDESGKYDEQQPESSIPIHICIYIYLVFSTRSQFMVALTWYSAMKNLCSLHGTCALLAVLVVKLGPQPHEGQAQPSASVPAIVRYNLRSARLESSARGNPLN